MKASTLYVGAMLAIVWSGQVAALAQENAPPGPAFRLVHEKLQEQIDRAAAEGYAVALAWPGYDMAVLRRRAAAEPRQAYRVLNGRKAIERGLAEGHRAVWDTLDVKDGALLVIAIASADTDHYESLLLQTNRTATLDRELQSASAKGFQVTGIASDESGHAVLLERRAADPTQHEPNAVALIAANRQETIQKELADRAAAGYRIAGASAWKEAVLILQQDHDEAALEYRVLSTTKSSTLEREMNAAASNGFRLTAGTLHAQQKGSVLGLAATGHEYVAIMEKPKVTGTAPEYVVVGAKRFSTLAREFDDAVAKGLVPLALTLGYAGQETLVVFERPRP